MARHRGSPRHPLLLVAVLTTVAVVLAAGGAYAVWRAYGDRSPGQVAPTATAGGGASVGGGDVQATGSTTSAPATSSATTAGGPSAAALAALQRCAVTVRAQESLARAVAGSAAHWQTHTDAQRRLDAGTFTVAQTVAAWASSKAKGPADLKAFASADAALKQAAGGCDTVLRDTSGTLVAARADACAQRSTLLAQVVSTGTAVQNQWSAHIEMMAMKAHTTKAAYHDRWMQMVKDSGPVLATYRSAAAAAAKAPACTP